MLESEASWRRGVGQASYVLRHSFILLLGPRAERFLAAPIPTLGSISRLTEFVHRLARQALLRVSVLRSIGWSYRL